MLSRLAATVCRTTLGTMSRPLASGLIRPRTVRVTKVISATSFVTAMLEKKQCRTRIHTSCRVFRTLVKESLDDQTPVVCSPAMAPIRQNKTARMRKSI